MTNIWPHQRELRRVFGPPGTRITRIPAPYPLYLSWDTKTRAERIAVHEAVAESAARALSRIARTFTPAEREARGLHLFGGSYSNRAIRGGTVPSTHAWAAALDFDPERNQLRWGRDRARLAKPDCEAFWQIWEEEGWVSLGRARDFDFMHVQAVRI